MKKEWHWLEHKDTGEVQVVACLGGIDLDVWDAVPIVGNRPPNEFQTVDAGGKLATDSDRKGKAAARRPYKALSDDELIDQIVATERRLDALEALLKK